MLPHSLPLLSKQAPPASLTVSPSPSPTEPISYSKKRCRLAVKRALFTSLMGKKLKSDVATKKKSDGTLAVKTVEENVSDSDNLPIISLNMKTAQGSSKTTSADSYPQNRFK